LRRAIEADDRHDEVYVAWQCAQQLRSVYHQNNPADGRRIAKKIIASFPTCPIPEIARLGRTLKQWRQAFLAYFDTGGASNGGTEAVNGLIELHRRIARGFRNRHNYRLRMLLIAGGLKPRHTARSDRHSPPSASMTATSRSTRPGSCRDRRARRDACRRPNAAVNPTASGTSASNLVPACPTTPSPSRVTSIEPHVLLRCTRKMNPLIEEDGSLQPAFFLVRGFLRPNPTRHHSRYRTVEASVSPARATDESGLEPNLVERSPMRYDHHSLCGPATQTSITSGSGCATRRVRRSAWPIPSLSLLLLGPSRKPRK
jgi:hypothetical protein